MSHDALFQLGMGSVLLIASQTEEILAARAARAPARAIDRGSPGRPGGHPARLHADPFHRQTKRRGNSAKALAFRGDLAAPPPSA